MEYTAYKINVTVLSSEYPDGILPVVMFSINSNDKGISLRRGRPPGISLRPYVDDVWGGTAPLRVDLESSVSLESFYLFIRMGVRISGNSKQTIIGKLKIPLSKLFMDQDDSIRTLKLSPAGKLKVRMTFEKDTAMVPATTPPFSLGPRPRRHPLCIDIPLYRSHNDNVSLDKDGCLMDQSEQANGMSCQESQEVVTGGTESTNERIFESLVVDRFDKGFRDLSQIVGKLVQASEKQTTSIDRLSMLFEGLIGKMSSIMNQDHEAQGPSVKEAPEKIDRGIASHQVEELPMCLSMGKPTGNKNPIDPTIKALFVDNQGRIHPTHKVTEVQESIPRGEEHTLGMPRALWNPTIAGEHPSSN